MFSPSFFYFLNSGTIRELVECSIKQNGKVGNDVDEVPEHDLWCFAEREFGYYLQKCTVEKLKGERICAWPVPTVIFSNPIFFSL